MGSTSLPNIALAKFDGDFNLPLSNQPYSTDPTYFPDTFHVSKLDRQSEDYKEYIIEWTELALLYESGYRLRQNASRFLRMRHKEPADVYQSRLSQFTDNNLIETILGWFTSYLFRREPEVDILDRVNNKPLIDTTVTRTDGSVKGSANDRAGKFYADFRNNVDRAQTPLSGFFTKVVTHLLLNGRVYILTDLEPYDTVPASREHVEQLGYNRPYLMIYGASDVINYRTDKEGNIVWAVLKAGRVEQKTPFDDPQVVDQWWIYDRTSWALYEYVHPPKGTEQNDNLPKTAQLIASGLHALYTQNRCPIRRFNAPEGMWLGNRIYLPILSYINEDNTLQWLLSMTNLPVPVIIGGGEENGEGGEVASLRYYSEIYAINLPKGADIKWMSPDSTAASTSMKRCEKLVEEIHRLCYVTEQGRPASTITSQRSGAAIEAEKLPSREVAEALGRYIREMMTKTYQDIIDVRGETESVSASIRGYTFLENYVGIDLSDATRLKDIGVPSPTLMKYVFKIIARRYMQDAPTRLVDMVLDEIENGLLDTTVMDFAASAWVPLTPDEETKILKPDKIPTKLQLIEAQ